MVFSPDNKKSGAVDAVRCYDIFSACQAWHFVVVEHVDLLTPPPVSPHAFSFFIIF